MLDIFVHSFSFFLSNSPCFGGGSASYFLHHYFKNLSLECQETFSFALVACPLNLVIMNIIGEHEGKWTFIFQMEKLIVLNIVGKHEENLGFLLYTK
mgnify:CR=1 FL=1